MSLSTEHETPQAKHPVTVSNRGTWLAMLVPAVVFTVALWAWSHHRTNAGDAQGPGDKARPIHEAVAQVLVVSRRAPDRSGPGADPREAGAELAATFGAILKSHEVVYAAVKKHKLADLKSFSGEDPVSVSFVVMDGLSFRQDPKLKTVLEVSYRGTDPQDAVAVLRAVLDSGARYVDDIYGETSRVTLKLMNDAKDVFQNHLKEAQNRYREFLEKTPYVFGDSREHGLTFLTALEAKKAALIATRAELKGQLSWLEKAIADNRSRTAILLKANEWVTRVGYDKLPPDAKKDKDVVAAYRESLREQLEEIAAIENELQLELDEGRRRVKDLYILVAKSESLRTDMKESQEVLNTIVKKLNEVQFAGEGGWVVRVLSPPRIVKER